MGLCCPRCCPWDAIANRAACLRAHGPLRQSIVASHSSIYGRERRGHTSYLGIAGLLISLNHLGIIIFIELQSLQAKGCLMVLGTVGRKEGKKKLKPSHAIYFCRKEFALRGGCV